eukprot:655836-Amorphochlora_amoeboformis.AAC.1
MEDIRRDTGVMRIEVKRGRTVNNAAKGASKSEEWSAANPGEDAGDWADSLPADIKSFVDLDIIGTPSSVETACMMLSVKLKHIEENNELISSKKTVQEELHRIESEYGIRQGEGRGMGRARRGGRRGETDEKGGEAGKPDGKSRGRRKNRRQKSYGDDGKTGGEGEQAKEASKDETGNRESKRRRGRKRNKNRK